MIAHSLREAVVAFYAVRGETLDHAAGRLTLETNSSLVERRARPLVDLALEQTGLESLQGFRVADLGCGFGALSVYFACQGARVTGLDPNGRRLEVGRAVAAGHGLDVEFIPGRMQSTELPDGAFDLVVMNNSLCYIVKRADRRAALAASLRILRPGGLIITRNPNRLHPRDQFSGLPLVQLLPPGMAGVVTQALGRGRSEVRLTSTQKAKREFRRAGFTEVSNARLRERGMPALERWARYHHIAAAKPSTG